MFRSFRFLFLATILVCLALPSQAANILANPGFETGTFSGWTFAGGSPGGVGDFNCVVDKTAAMVPQYGGDPPGGSGLGCGVSALIPPAGAPYTQDPLLYVESGRYGTFLGNPDAPITMYQAFALTGGTTYSFYFDWRHHLSFATTPQTGELDFIFGTVGVDDPATVLPIFQIASNADLQTTTPWRQDAIGIVPGSNGNYFIGFRWSSVWGEFAVDNACLDAKGGVCDSQVPEPSTMALLGLPLAALGLLRRKRS